MQSAVNKLAQPGIKKKQATEDELMDSIDNLDMLLANMKQGDSNRENAIRKLGDKFSVFEEQEKKRRLVDDDFNENLQQENSKKQQNSQSQAQAESAEEVASSSLKSAELKKANLDKLPVQPQSYQQPFQVPQQQERESLFITGGAGMEDDDDDQADEVQSKASQNTFAAPPRPPISTIS